MARDGVCGFYLEGYQSFWLYTPKSVRFARTLSELRMSLHEKIYMLLCHMRDNPEFQRRTNTLDITPARMVLTEMNIFVIYEGR